MTNLHQITKDELIDKAYEMMDMQVKRIVKNRSTKYIVEWLHEADCPIYHEERACADHCGIWRGYVDLPTGGQIIFEWIDKLGGRSISVYKN